MVAAKFLGVPGIAELRFDAVRGPATGGAADRPGISAATVDDLLRRQTGELSAEQFIREPEAARQRGRDDPAQARYADVPNNVVQFSGLPIEICEGAAQELLESILPAELGHPRKLRSEPPFAGAGDVLDSLGIEDADLVSDFPIVLATYGYSRLESLPRRPGGNDVLCRLNPLPQDREPNGRWPIYVDETTADALFFRLSAPRVVEWLQANGVNVMLPRAANPTAGARGYVVGLLSGQRMRETIPSTAREARMVFGLLHTLSHVMVKEAALLCSLERTSLAEYLLPTSLAFAIYCNHRSGQTIGALTALFEQSIGEWFAAGRARRRCVYDPVCKEDGGACHSCAHLSETSCRFFNMNLSRAFLFGGHDTQLGQIQVGYLDMQRWHRPAYVMEVAGEIKNVSLVITAPEPYGPRLAVDAAVRMTLGVLTELAVGAREKLVLAAPYLSEEVFESGVSAASVQAALNRGVLVELATTWKQIESLPGGLARRQRDGQLRLYRPAANLLSEKHLGSHAKFRVADSVAAHLGSANFTGLGLGGHLEMGVLLKGKLAADIALFWEMLKEQGVFRTI